MTRETADKLKAHWPILVIIGSIFISGWALRETLSSEIDRKVSQVESRINERIGTIQDDVRDIRNFLLESRAGPGMGPP